jgi:hypothetical protein
MRFAIALFIAIASSACTTQPVREPSVILNPSLLVEGASTSTVPTSWQADGTAEELVVDAAVAKQGRPSWRVKFKEGAPYAGLVQRLPVEAILGRTLVVEAWLARNTERASVGVWIRAFDKDRKSIAYANSYEKPLPATSSLHQHVFEFVVPPTATALMVGASIYGENGIAWFNSIDVYASSKRE